MEATHGTRLVVLILCASVEGRVAVGLLPPVTARDPTSTQGIHPELGLLERRLG